MKIQAYVDGSYKDGKVSWAVIIVKGGKLYGEFSGVLNDKDVLGTRQVAGELKAVEEVIFWCKKQKVKEISIHYDYAGIREWVTGAWKAKNLVTQKYRDCVRACGLKISWIKVKSHSGVKYNDMADKLAREMVSD